MACDKCCKCTCYPKSNGYQPKKSEILPPPLPPESYKAKSKWFGLIVERPPKRP